VRESQEETTDPYLKTFIDCLLASADYESFYKVMVREGKKKALKLKAAALKSEEKGSAAGDDKSTATVAEGKGAYEREAEVDRKGGDADAKGARDDYSDVKGESK